MASTSHGTSFTKLPDGKTRGDAFARAARRANPGSLVTASVTANAWPTSPPNCVPHRPLGAG
eukprot:6212935-Lingulodinium_polyedra.AAC.1